jgi:hypothetical protein
MPSVSPGIRLKTRRCPVSRSRTISMPMFGIWGNVRWMLSANARTSSSCACWTIRVTPFAAISGRQSPEPEGLAMSAPRLPSKRSRVLVNVSGRALEKAALRPRKAPTQDTLEVGRKDAAMAQGGRFSTLTVVRRKTRSYRLSGPNLRFRFINQRLTAEDRG